MTVLSRRSLANAIQALLEDRSSQGNNYFGLGVFKVFVI